MKPEIEQIDTEYMREVARILGHSAELSKTAKALANTPMAGLLPTKVKPGEVAKKGMSKLGSMPMKEVLTNEHFCRGFYDEIEARRAEWEPLVVAALQGKK